MLAAVLVAGCAGEASPLARISIPEADTASPDPRVASDPSYTPPADLESLKELLSSLSAGWDGRVAIGVTDLQTGQAIGQRRRATFRRVYHQTLRGDGGCPEYRCRPLSGVQR